MTPRTTLRHIALAALATLSLQALAAQPDANHPAVQRALKHLGAGAAAEAKASAADRYTATDLVVDADGTEHVRFERSFKGLPVIAGDLIVRNRPDGALGGVIQSLASQLALDTTPTLAGATATAKAMGHFKHLQAVPQGQTLVVYARGRQPELAYDVAINGVQRDGTPSEAHLIIHAHTGKLLDQWDLVETGAAVGTGKTLYSGDVSLDTKVNSRGTKYQLTDLVRGKQYTVTMNNGTSTETKFTDADNIWGTNLKTNAQTAAADAHYGMAMTWDYYLNVHGRSGIANDGRGARSRVHYSSGYDNAFWSDGCFCMTYGDGSFFNPLVSLDVAGHEMTHGVTSRTARLIDRKSTRLNSSHSQQSRMPSSA